MTDGKPIFTYNWVGLEKYHIASAQKISAGPHTLKFNFEYAGGRGGAGTATISVDGKKIAAGNILHTNGNTFGIDESADVGEDQNTPVDPVYNHKSKFTGKISKVTIETKPTVLSEADKAELKKQQDEAAALRE